MSTERKSFVSIHGLFDLDTIIRHREAFGWKLDNFDGERANMTKDYTLPSTIKLYDLERKYDQALASYRTYSKKAEPTIFTSDLFYLLFIVLVLPVIFHKIYKNNMSKNAKNAVDSMLSIYEEAKSVN